MKIAILGSGNVATHLAKALKAKGEKVVQIFSPNLENAKLLAEKIETNFTNNIGEIDLNADLYIIAVKDDAIETIAKALKNVNGIVVHTSGTTDLNVLSDQVKNAGVFYPLQTFSKDREIVFDKVPLCIEAENKSHLVILANLADKLSNQVYQLNSQKRKVLHLAAVFASNFPNHLYNLANQILEKNDLDFNIIRPLIAETADKIQNYLPENVQTGPAIRGDESTINKHLRMLTDLPDLQNIYQTISDSIKITYK